MKKVLSAILAAAMISLTAIAASAVDYAEDPSYSEPEKPGQSSENVPTGVTLEVLPVVIAAAVATGAAVVSKKRK